MRKKEVEKCKWLANDKVKEKWKKWMEREKEGEEEQNWGERKSENERKFKKTCR